MTEIAQRPEQTDTAQALDWADPSELPVEEVRDVFLTLSKALRAYQLYDHNNPVYRRFLANLEEALNRIWETRDSVQVLIEEDRFTWMGEEVYRNENRADSLAFMFYRDGVRDVTLKEGIHETELEGLLDALHRTRGTRGDGEDLVTVLWDLDMRHVSYSAIEVGSDGPGMDLEGLGEPAQFDASTILEEELSEEETEETRNVEPEAASSSAQGAISAQDFNPTLHALDETDRVYLRRELQKELDRDLAGEVLNALFDRLEEQERPERQSEILEILRSLVPNFLSHGALAEAARVIRELGQISEAGVLSSTAESIATGLTEDLSSPEAVDELIRALEDGNVSPDAEELGELLQHLREGALTALLKGAEETHSAIVADTLRNAIKGIAERNRDVVIRLLGADDPSVASGAVRLVAKMQIAEASDALVHLLESGPPALRRVVVETAADVASPVLGGALQRLLRDGDRELRVAAARALAEMGHAPAADAFRAVIEDKEFREADVTEKVAFFEAYGLLAGEEGVAFLGQILNRKSLLGRREPAEIRAGAALGLGKVGGPKSIEALRRASDDDEAVVRSAVSRALRGDEAAE